MPDKLVVDCSSGARSRPPWTAADEAGRPVAAWVGDGVTDDLGAFDALVASLSVGEEGYVPPGTYRLSGQWVVSKAVTIRFAPGARLLSGWTDPPSVADALVLVTAAAELVDVAIDGADRPHRGIQTAAPNVKLIRPRVENVGGRGIEVPFGSTYTLIVDPYVRRTMLGKLDGQAGAIRIGANHVDVVGGNVHAAHGKGVAFNSCNNGRVFRTVVHDTQADAGDAFYCSNASDVQFVDVKSLDSQGSGIKLSTGSLRCTVSPGSMFVKSRGVAGSNPLTIQGASDCTLQGTAVLSAAWGTSGAYVDYHPTAPHPADDNYVSVRCRNPGGASGANGVHVGPNAARTTVERCYIDGFAVGVKDEGSNTRIVNNPRISADAVFAGVGDGRVAYHNNGEAGLAI